MSAEPSAKKAKLDDLPSHLSGMGEEAKKALLELDNVQTEIDQLNEKASDEILKVNPNLMFFSCSLFRLNRSIMLSEFLITKNVWD